jgi:hypothetical protein
MGAARTCAATGARQLQDRRPKGDDSPGLSPNYSRRAEWLRDVSPYTLGK